MANDPYNALRICGPTAALARFKDVVTEAGSRLIPRVDLPEVFDLPDAGGALCSTRLIEECRNSLLYGFFSAGGPPLAIVLAASEQFPALVFLLSYWEDGIGYRGREVYRAGRVLDEVEGSYGPDGDEAYDQADPLRDILTSHYIDLALRVSAASAPARCAACEEEFLTRIGGAEPRLQDGRPLCTGCHMCAEADARVVQLYCESGDLPDEVLALASAAVTINDNLRTYTNIYSRQSADLLYEILERRPEAFVIEFDRPAHRGDLLGALDTAPTILRAGFTDELSVLRHVAPGHAFSRTATPDPVRLKAPLEYELRYSDEALLRRCSFCRAMFQTTVGPRQAHRKRAADDLVCAACQMCAEAGLRAVTLHAPRNDPRFSQRLRPVADAMRFPHEEGCPAHFSAQGDKRIWHSLVSREDALRLHLLAETNPEDLFITRDHPATARELRRALEIAHRRDARAFNFAGDVLKAVAPQHRFSCEPVSF